MAVSQWNEPVAIYGMGPAEVLDYGINWASGAPPLGLGSWLAPGETIVGTPVVTQDGGDGLLTINPNGNGTLVSGGIVTWWLSTPTVGYNYNVHVTITTSQGRTSTRRICIRGIAR